MKSQKFMLASVIINMITVLAHPVMAQDIAPGGAQSSSNESSDADTAQTDSTRLGEIVVTAQRRSENLQRVPLSVTSLSSDKLAQSGITNSEQIALVTPGLTLNSGGGFPQPFLRGVGSDRTANSEPSVATYIDGVYVAFSAGTTQQLFDVERVEVLRGPQGTLYGRNATGGAINIVTKRPSDELSATFSGSAGSYDLASVSGYLTGPLGEDFQASLAVSAMRQDSFNTNISPRRQPGGSDHESAISGRAKLLWTSSTAFEAELSLDILRTASFDAEAYRQIQSNAVGFSRGGITGSKPYEVAYAEPVYSDVRQYGGSLRMSGQGGGIKYLSLSGYRNTKHYSPVELGATDVTVTRVFIKPINSRQFSQEFQLLSGDGNPFQWIVGAYYFHELSGNNPYNLTVPPVIKQATDISAKTDSYSLFAQATVPITASLSLVGGVRQTWENKKVEDFTLTNLLVTPAVTTVLRGKKANFNKFTFRAGVNYQANPDTLIYASYSRGFKSGIFNLSNPADIGPAMPETLDSAEVGVKADLLDNRLRVNVSAFHYDFKNLQVQSLLAGTGSVVLRNAAKARMSGAEVEIVAVPASNLQITSGLSFLDSKYKSFLNYPAFVARPAPAFGNAALPSDLTGRELIRAPGFTASVGAQYTMPIGANDLRFNGVLFHSDSYNFEPSGRSRQSAYELLNASVTFAPASGSWDLTVWGKNLTDQRYYRTSLVTTLGESVIYGDPVTGGVTITVHFGARK